MQPAALAGTNIIKEGGIMKRISIVAAGVCLIALPAVAETGSGAMGSAGTDSGAIGSGALGSGSAATGSGAAANTGSMTALGNGPVEIDASQFAPPSARVNGRVSDVSHTTGAVRLQSSSAPLRLHFPTQALSGINENAPIIVHIAYTLGEAPTAEQEAAANVGATGAGAGQVANPPAQAGDTGGRGYTLPAAAANVADEYSVKGTFSKIDQNYGLVTFTPEPMMLTVYLPRESLQSVKPGDPVSAEVAFLKSPGGVTARAGDAPSGQPSTATARQGAHWMKATVTDVDQARGVFVAQADKFTLQLPIPAAMKDQIAANKTIAINLSFEPDTCTGPRATM